MYHHRLFKKSIPRSYLIKQSQLSSIEIPGRFNSIIDLYHTLSSDVLWELSVHGLTSSPDVQLPATHLLINLLTMVTHEAPTTQHKFYRALHNSLFFVISALVHVPEMRDTMRSYLADNARFMTEVESVKVWVAMLFSRCELVRKWPLEELAKWAASQGVVSLI